MSVPPTDIHRSALSDDTPLATRIALVATVVITSVATVNITGRPALEARETAAYLLLFSLLFLLRVIGQIVVVLRGPAWLPPMRQWHLMPYRLLLPSQIGILALMALIEVSLIGGWRPLGEAHPRFGGFLIGFSFVYAGVMAIRYVVRMYRRPGERWFGGTIPIVFHFVLAAFLFTWGKYNASG